MTAPVITIQALVKASKEQVWECWNDPQHIMQWAFASDDWECPAAENDPRVEGRFKNTLAAKDKSMSFDFSGTYTVVDLHQRLDYTLDDDRKVSVVFTETPEGVQVVQSFEAEPENPIHFQQLGWQAILDNFATYAESRA